MMIFAHRGFTDYAPENSLSAVQAALDNPLIQGVEVDVHAVKDIYGNPQLIVFHDKKLGRMTRYKNVSLHRLSFEEIRSLQLEN